MPEMILARNRHVACLSGHAVTFVKDVPVYVPPPAVQECMAIGAIPVEDFELPEADVDPAIKAVTDPVERKSLIIKAFETLRQRNARGDFDAAGKPHPKAVSALVGFTVESKERNAVWAEVMEAGG